MHFLQIINYEAYTSIFEHFQLMIIPQFLVFREHLYIIIENNILFEHNVLIAVLFILQFSLSLKNSASMKEHF